VEHATAPRTPGYVPPVEFENRSHTHPHPSGDTVTVDRTREELKTE
jgi:hypothetical protein